MPPRSAGHRVVDFTNDDVPAANCSAIPRRGAGVGGNALAAKIEHTAVVKSDHIFASIRCVTHVAPFRFLEVPCQSGVDMIEHHQQQREPLQPLQLALLSAAAGPC
jgi:hypothetical protein